MSRSVFRSGTLAPRRTDAHETVATIVASRAHPAMRRATARLCRPSWHEEKRTLGWTRRNRLDTSRRRAQRHLLPPRRLLRELICADFARFRPSTNLASPQVFGSTSCHAALGQPAFLPVLERRCHWSHRGDGPAPGGAPILVVLLGLSVGELFAGAFEPMIAHRVNTAITSAQRATVLSVEGFLYSVTMIWAFPLFGGTAERYGWLPVDGVAGGVVVALLGVFVMLGVGRPLGRVNERVAPH
jgi:hypothetical protein